MTSQGPNNLRSLLEVRVAASPAKDFLFSEADGRRFTYNEFDVLVNRVATLLSELGIKKGDVVSLLLPNSIEYVIGYFACWKIGAVAGPVNSLLKPHEMVFILANSDAKALLVNSAFEPSIDEIRSELPSLQAVVTFDDVEATANEFESESEVR